MLSDTRSQPPSDANPTPSTEQQTTSNELTLTVDKEKASVPCDMDMNSFLCMATVTAPEQEEEDEEARAGMDIVAVIDRSGSMRGNKMTMLHNTVKLMIDNLGSSDRLSLVAYDDRVETPLELTRMDNDGKEKARRALKLIDPRSTTDISSAMLCGLRMLEERGDDKNEVAAVLLMTDGLANRGITDPDELAKAAKDQIQSMQSTVTMYSFGFGTDHDAALMSQLADSGNGNYYFIETADSIPNAFADCLGGLMSVVAQNIELTVTASSHVVIHSVSSAFDVTTEQEGACYVVPIGDMFSEEKRDILVDVQLGTVGAATPAQPLVSFKLRSFNVATTNTDASQATVTVERTEAGSDVGETSVKVDEQRNRLRTAQAMEEAQRFGQAGAVEDAKRVLLECQQIIDSSASRDQSAAYGNELLQVSNEMVSEEAYDRVVSRKLASKAGKHRKQRGAESSVVESDVYTTSSKARTKKKFGIFS